MIFSFVYVLKYQNKIYDTYVITYFIHIFSITTFVFLTCDRPKQDNKLRRIHLNSKPVTTRNKNTRYNEIDANMEPIAGPSRENQADNQRRDEIACRASDSLRLNARGFERMTISPR